jgi:hypothetical protein
MPVKQEPCLRIFASGAFHSGRLTYSSAPWPPGFTRFLQNEGNSASPYHYSHKKQQLILLGHKQAGDCARKLRPNSSPGVPPATSKIAPSELLAGPQDFCTPSRQRAGRTSTQVRPRKLTILGNFTYVEGDLELDAVIAAKSATRFRSIEMSN